MSPEGLASNRQWPPPMLLEWECVSKCVWKDNQRECNLDLFPANQEPPSPCSPLSFSPLCPFLLKCWKSPFVQRVILYVTTHSHFYVIISRTARRAIINQHEKVRRNMQTILPYYESQMSRCLCESKPGTTRQDRL